jgi:hypothetical protein
MTKSIVAVVKLDYQLVDENFETTMSMNKTDLNLFEYSQTQKIIVKVDEMFIRK